MDNADYNFRFHEALAKAFAASAPNVRAAYFDLADFYCGKLGPNVQMQPTKQVLTKQLGATRRLR